MNDQTAAPVFTIETGVAIPARTIPNAGPRDSKYPVDTLQPGQAFAVPVKDDKEARQKQSQFSGLAKTRGIKLITRFFATESPFKNTPAPCLGVWHDGVRTEEEKAADAAKAAARAAKAANKAAGSNEAAPVTPATSEASAPAASADDTIEL